MTRSSLALPRISALVACALLSGCVAAGESPVEKPLSYVEIKNAATVRQRFDFSCGAAVVATVLTHYWSTPTSELDVMNILRARYPDKDWKALQDKGFSFDDLIYAADKLGFKAQGAEIPAEEIEKLDGPIIVHLDKGKFQHFSVVRKSQAGRIALSDPIVGAIFMSSDEFSRQYTGKALAIWKDGKPLPKSALLARPYAPIDPSTIIGGAASFYHFHIGPYL